MNTNKDCGDGIVYLERVEDSDFEKEPFLGSNDKKVRSVIHQENYLLEKILRLIELQKQEKTIH